MKFNLVIQQLQYDLDYYINQKLKCRTGYLKQLEAAIKLLQEAQNESNL